MVFKIRIIGAVASLVSFLSARIDLRCFFCLRIIILCPCFLLYKSKSRNVSIIIFPVIGKTFCCLLHAVNQQIARKLGSIARPVHSAKGLVCGIVNSLYGSADVLHGITA